MSKRSSPSWRHHLSMLCQKLIFCIPKPPSVIGKEQRAALPLQAEGQHLCLHQTQLDKQRPSQRHSLRVRSASNSAAMAQSVLSKPHRFILVSDLDWTMVDHHDHDNKALKAFNELWESKFAKDSLLVFSTGRSHALYSSLRKEVPLGNPDVLVCSVGTEIFFEATGASPEANQEWRTELDQGWNRQAAIDAASKCSELKPQDPSEQRPHKLSYHLSARGEDAQRVISQLQEALKSKGVRAKIIYSGGMDVDILPEGASKGEGLNFLLRQIKEAGNAPRDGVMVCGDSGNDVELFAVPGVRGCMVVNAHQELKQWCDAHPSPDLFQATQRCAGGIVEALHHFKLVPQN